VLGSSQSFETFEPLTRNLLGRETKGCKVGSKLAEEELKKEIALSKIEGEFAGIVLRLSSQA
jgi:hypothetical protein